MLYYRTKVPSGALLPVSLQPLTEYAVEKVRYFQRGKGAVIDNPAGGSNMRCPRLAAQVGKYSLTPITQDNGILMLLITPSLKIALSR